MIKSSRHSGFRRNDELINLFVPVVLRLFTLGRFHENWR